MKKTAVFAGLAAAVSAHIVTPGSAVAGTYFENTGRVDWASVRRVQAEIQTLPGVTVRWDNSNAGTCKYETGTEGQMLGVWKPATREIVMCGRRLRDYKMDPLATLQHEGWHALQTLCNNGQPIFSSTYVQATITPQQRQTVLAFYDADQWAIEYDARASEHFRPATYLQLFNKQRAQSCGAAVQLKLPIAQRAGGWANYIYPLPHTQAEAMRRYKLLPQQARTWMMTSFAAHCMATRGHWTKPESMFYFRSHFGALAEIEPDAIHYVRVMGDGLDGCSYATKHMLSGEAHQDILKRRTELAGDRFATPQPEMY